ncbi:interleukin-5 receptor subunit alpha [Phocoena phocoena]|uniref:interleukin-5 receptor subunit alpha n=1 Tax=Phocoena phocoena TaxID=9742 RepID=UPI0033075AC3
MTGPCSRLLPHSPSAPRITSPESHPSTPRLPSSVIPPRFPHKVLDRNGRPSGARPRGRERARGQRDVADTLPRDLHVGLCPLVRKRPLTAPGARLPQDPARARARRQLASSPPLPLPAARTRRYPARPLTGPAAPSSPRALPGGRRGDVTDARRSTANGKSQQGVGGARAGSPRPFHLPAEAARWSAVPQLLPGLSSQSSLLGRPEGPGSDVIIMAPASLILLGATVILQVDLLPDKKFLLLPPVNFTIKAINLAQVLLRWEPNTDQEQRNVQLGYHVKINAPQEEDYETRNTESRRITILHKGFSASVQTVPWSDRSLQPSSWVSAELRAPPGSPGTSIVNLTCTTNTKANNSTHLRPYQVSLHCTWLVDKDAPEDTQYFLYYRYGSWTEECQEYSKDTLQRNIACWFPRTFINSKGRDLLAVYVNGSSEEAVIKPFDELFALHAIDRVNPPAKVTAEIEGTCLSIQWEKPVSAFPVHCFDYEVKIYNTRKGYFQTEKMTTNTFISVIDGISEYSIQVRAAVSSVCRAVGPPSDWSEPIYVGNDEQKPWTTWFLIAVMATICFILLIFSLICRRCHLWTKVFPPVPAPKSNIKEFFVTINYEKTGSNETETEVISYAEEAGSETLEDSVF